MGNQGIPGICKSTIIDQSVAGLSWEILSPSGERDAQTEGRQPGRPKSGRGTIDPKRYETELKWFAREAYGAKKIKPPSKLNLKHWLLNIMSSHRYRDRM